MFVPRRMKTRLNPFIAGRALGHMVRAGARHYSGVTSS